MNNLDIDRKSGSNPKTKMDKKQDLGKEQLLKIMIRKEEQVLMLSKENNRLLQEVNKMSQTVKDLNYKMRELDDHNSQLVG